MIDASRLEKDAADASGDALNSAAQWHGLFEEGEPGVQERERFEAWLAADPSHRPAYGSVERSWTGMAQVAVDERIIAMRREALAAPRTIRSRWWRSTAIIASILVAATVAGVLLHIGLTGSAHTGEFATQVGQRSNITLADGSTVVLNTASHIQVSFDDHVRRVRLLAGQAWFEVAKNQSRPFVVEAGAQRVTAHGTAFDVRLEERDQVQVTLVEGRVSVDALEHDGSGSNISGEHEDLLPGDQLVIAPARSATKRRADVTRATSWREGQIIFDDDTLSNAVAEVNRYSAKKIVLADPRLASLRMSGVFIAGHNDSFIETVTGNFPIKVTQTADGQLLLVPAN